MSAWFRAATALAGLLAMQVAAFRARADDTIRLDPDQLARHFAELAMAFASPDTAVGTDAATQSVLRWSEPSLHMTFLAPDKSRLVQSASSGIGLLTGMFSDAVEIEQTDTMLAAKGQVAKALEADLLFIVGDTQADLAPLLQASDTARQAPGDLVWLEDDAAFGPGCGIAIGYAADSKSIKKAILTIRGDALLGPDGATLDRRLVNGLTFNCTNRQLVAALGLAKDWGSGVSAPNYSTFVNPRHAPFYDSSALQILYLDAFRTPLEPAEFAQVVTANAACLADTWRLCASP